MRTGSFSDHQQPSRLAVDVDLQGRISVRLAPWADCRLEGLLPGVRIDGRDQEPAGATVQEADANGVTLTYDFRPFRMDLRFEHFRPSAVMLTGSLVNEGERDVVLDEVTLLRSSSGSYEICFGRDPRRVRIFEQSNYRGRVRPLACTSHPAAGAASAAAEPAGALVPPGRTSNLVWVAYDQDARQALLVGFLSSERWLGRVQVSATAGGEVASWRVGFDGGKLAFAPRESLALEPVLFSSGEDPWALLEEYGDAVCARHRPVTPAGPVISWCTWYPYRLAVTEDRVVENARVAAERLRPLGLRIVEVDLGWQSGNLPCSFTENGRFPHGLKWLAAELGALGFELGAWSAPFSISEFDPLAEEHPEWLVADEAGRPLAQGEWFWEPHGKVYTLDLTHPGALQWLRDRVQGLTDRGVRYFKFDFIGCATEDRAKRRHDCHVVAGGGTEAARRAAAIMREAAPDALILNCGGPEMPGTGHWPLLYTCYDTGNSGFVSHSQQAGNYEAVACHLFKNRRWGVIQPSCLVVGLPGTVEDARLRATAAFLAAGQIDISDTLTTLPEDRWKILTATLPPPPGTARPVDLFDPLEAVPFDYEATCRGQQQPEQPVREHPPGSVWHLHLSADWDEWDLVGVLCYASGSSAAKPEISRYVIPFARIGIPEAEQRWAYEFWSGQFIGLTPGRRRNAGGYVHPGDYQDLIVGDASGTLDVAFFGPGAKLLSLRRPRPNPWVVGTSFHQSCGLELRNVRWDEAAFRLSGELSRPAGESGVIVIACAGMSAVKHEVGGRLAAVRRGASGSLIMPLIAESNPVGWCVEFRKSDG